MPAAVRRRRGGLPGRGHHPAAARRPLHALALAGAHPDRQCDILDHIRNRALLASAWPGRQISRQGSDVTSRRLEDRADGAGIRPRSPGADFQTMRGSWPRDSTSPGCRSDGRLGVFAADRWRTVDLRPATKGIGMGPQLYSCPSCRGGVAPGAAFCPWCGTRFAQPMPSAPPQPQWVQPQYVAPPPQPSLGGSITQGFGWGCGCLLVGVAIVVIFFLLVVNAAPH